MSEKAVFFNNLVSCCKQSGFTLLETLIALFVFSIGLLGLASLQMTSLRLSHDSYLRSLAAIQANDMIARMRTNVDATSLGVSSPYNNPNKVATANTNCLGMNASGSYINTSCSTTQMAGHDFYEWYAAIRGASATSWHPTISAQLPSGNGVVCVDSTPQDGTPTSPACDNVVAVPGKVVFAVKIWWIERQNPQSPGTLHSYITSFSL